MLAIKAVCQRVQLPLELLDVFEKFREMVNYSIRVGLDKDITSRFKLSNEVYGALHNRLHTWYILSAVEKATAILKNHRKEKRKNPEAKKPYVLRPFLSIGNQAYTITDGKLRLPIKPREFIYIPLNRHTLEVLSEPGLKLGSITLVASTSVLSISYSKEVDEIEPSGFIGLDRNLNNVTVAESGGETMRFNLSEATRIKAAYREVKSHLKRNDVKVRRRIYGKYGMKQSNRVSQILHRVSKTIVEEAKEKKLGIVMENLKGIRKLYRKGNWQGRDYRGKMNGWSFYELQRQVEYKARWEGLPVIYVKAGGTSSLCAVCGSKLYPNSTDRTVWCPQCLKATDRDTNAARNILSRGLRFGPIGAVNEGMVAEPVRQSANSIQPSLTTTPTPS